MSSNKKYWKSVEELDGNSSIVEALKNNEFVEEIPTDEFLGNSDALSSSSTTRRDFLKYVGFSTAAATLAACEGPVHLSIPYVTNKKNRSKAIFTKILIDILCPNPCQNLC